MIGALALYAATIDVQIWVAIIALLSVSVVGPLIQWILGQLKPKVEQDSLIVAGAERAVSTIAISLAAETARADRMAAERDQAHEEIRLRDERIVVLEAKLDALQLALDEVRAELHTFTLTTAESISQEKSN